jgi:Plavaka transposase
MNKHNECTTRCVQGIGGGPYRCTIQFCFKFCTEELSQRSLESRQPSATVIPLILSTDKTQLTVFGGKMAYPVYITIGNIPKEIRWKLSRCAQMLIGYIPTAKLEGIGNKTTHHCGLMNLFHCCMKILLDLITLHGKTGLPMMSGDGIWCRCHPIFANFIGDYPEQVLVTGTYYGECPKCEVPCNQLGEYATSSFCDYGNALNTYTLANGDVCVFHATCKASGIKPVFCPFWESFLLTNIYIAIIPDILHQLLQGVMKHLIMWLSNPMVFGQQSIDRWCRLMPPNHQIVLFPRGITTLSRVLGKEHKNMCCVLLGLIVDLYLADGSSSECILKAMHGLLNFLYLAQLPSQTANTISCPEDSLVVFHGNQDVFVDLGVQDHFNILKIHSLLHYSSSIHLFGITDNYNIEQTEWLHIDFTKDAYCVTNHKDEYNQMTTWLECRKKLQRHATFIKWQKQKHLPISIPPQRPLGPPQPGIRYLKMTQHPTLRRVPFDEVAYKYGAINFQDLLGNFLVLLKEPHVLGQALCNGGENTLIPFHHVPVFHKIKFGNSDGTIIDAIHIWPEQVDAHGWTIPAHFDMALAWTGLQSENTHGNKSEF